MSEIYCSHGKPILTTNECLQCELIWYFECFNDAIARVKSTADKIAEIQAKLAKEPE